MVRTWIFAVLLLAAPAAGARAQDPTPPGPPPPAQGAPDFLFGAPHGALGVRGGWFFARAGSDLFDFVRRQLTIDKNDFNAPAFGVDLSIALSPRVDILGDADFSRASVESEYRDFVDNKLLPINQKTSLRQRAISASVRYLLLPRGRAVSRLAWIPTGLTPYVGGGGGVMWYRFEQFGDFVDFVDSSVFPHAFKSEGYAPSVHLFGGANIHLYRALYMNVEGRYVWAHAKLGSDFVDFAPIDLAAFRATTGIQIAF
jgi:hypothetical protein